MSPGFMTSGFMPPGVVSPGILGSGGVGAWCGPSAAVLLCRALRRGRRGVAAAGRATVFPRQRDADQPLDVAQIAHFLGARDQRDRNALGAGARGAADAVD